MSLAELAELLKNSEFSLFLGAGASVPGGGPTSREFLQAIKTKFPVTMKNDDFFKAFDEIISSDNVKRGAVEKFVKTMLASITPTQDHSYLFSIPWKAVLTTDYDHVPDLLHSTLDNSRVILPVVGSEVRVDIRRDDHLYVLKLFGDMSYSFPHEGHMILSSTDRRRAYMKQAVLFRLFKDLARSAIIVYLGYSFDDALVFEILNDMLFELKHFPYRGFAITPEQPSADTLQRFKTFNVEWIKGSLEQFVVELKKVFGKTPVSFTTTTNPLKVHGKIVELSRSTLSNIRGKAKVIHQGLYESDYTDPRFFLDGTDRSLVPFQRDWDFPRKWNISYNSREIDRRQFESIKSLVDSRSGKGSSSDNLVYALVGSAGSGKSVVARRLAHNWYIRGNPVIFLDTSNVFLDSTAIENLLDEIWDGYRKQMADDEKLEDIRYLLVCDDGSLLLSQLSYLANELMSAGKPVDILIVDRSSNLEESLLKEMNVDAILKLDDSITSEERSDFIEHFTKIGILPHLSTLKANLDNPRINTSFFALMYTSIKEVQAPIRNIVTKEFEDKSIELKRLYAAVSLVQSYGLSPYHTILEKVCNTDFQSIKTQIEHGALQDVLYFADGEIAIVARHRIIADIVREYYFPTTDLIKRGLSTLVSAVSEGNVTEMGLVHKLLIHSSDVKLTLKPEQLEELFTVAADKVKTRPLLLHQARNQLRMKNFDGCRNSLKQAAQIQHPAFPESILHVFDVQGRLELALAKEEVSQRDEKAAWDHLEKAQGHFIQAKETPLSTPHPYLGLAQTYGEMARLQTESRDMLNLCVIAQNTLSDLKNNCPESFTLSQALELEREIFQTLKDTDFGEDEARILFERNRNANGFAFLAEAKADDDVDKALELVNKGLELDKTSIWLIRVKAQLLKKQFPENYDSLYDTLILYQRQRDRFFDVELAYELARLHFIKQEWALATRSFRELKSKSKGYRYRLNARDRWIQNGMPKKFSGIIQTPPTFEHWGTLRSMKPSIPSAIPVRHQDMDYEKYAKRDPIKFEIVFNMAGPQASNVTRD